MWFKRKKEPNEPQAPGHSRGASGGRRAIDKVAPEEPVDACRRQIHRVTVHGSAGLSRDSVGGVLLLDAEEPPVCAICGGRLALFLQSDVREGFGLAVTAGSHLVVMMCPFHNDIPELLPAGRLPDRYWTEGAGHCLLRLVPPTAPLRQLPEDPFVKAGALRFEPTEESVRAVAGVARGSQGFKVGGVPSWTQDPESFTCCCGAEMLFLCQVPQDFPFPKREDAPEQPDAFSKVDYCLFLGNETYLFACARQCDPGAVWAIVQN